MTVTATRGSIFTDLLRPGCWKRSHFCRRCAVWPPSRARRSLLAAEQQFSEVGYRAASLVTVAEAPRVTEPGLLYQFAVQGRAAAEPDTNA